MLESFKMRFEGLFTFVLLPDILFYTLLANFALKFLKNTHRTTKILFLKNIKMGIKHAEYFAQYKAD